MRIRSGNGVRHWSLIIREKRRIKEFENWILRRIFVQKLDGNEEWKKPHSE